MIQQIEFMAKVVTWVVLNEAVELELDLEDILQFLTVVPVATKILIIPSTLELWHQLLMRKPGNHFEFIRFFIFKQSWKSKMVKGLGDLGDQEIMVHLLLIL